MVRIGAIGTYVLGSLGSSLASGIVHVFVSMFTPELLSTFDWICQGLFRELSTSSTFDPHAPFLVETYLHIATIAAALVLPAVMVSVVIALFERSLSEIGKTLLVRIPTVVILSQGGLVLIGMMSTLIDGISTSLLVSKGASSSATGFGRLAAAATAKPTVPLLVGVVLLILGCVSAFGVWLEMILRSALLYVVAAFLPLASIGLLVPFGRSWLRRTAEVLSALLVSKVVIALTIALALGAVSDAFNASVSPAISVSLFLSSCALFLVAGFAPYLVVRLVPFAEAQLAAQLEGATSRVLRGAGRIANEGIEMAVGGWSQGVNPEITHFLGPQGSGIAPYVGPEPSDEFLDSRRNTPGAKMYFPTLIEDLDRRRAADSLDGSEPGGSIAYGEDDIDGP